ncbi:hypothetical protein QR680_016776 [Steinernema hermaphroditum]|uniref:Peptidase M28 domain-containing protein n=1 Tax=Steinernema hermaphroditum TaxID=289476 RepID=A0AA39HE86_9BILA|nr:hypothetical protein QR680_016776 [Steinernema hermaphroditum]
MRMHPMLPVFCLFTTVFGHFIDPSARNIVFGEGDFYENEEIEDILKRNIRWENIRDNLREFTKEPHVAGSEANSRLAEAIATKWEETGLEDVHFTEYDALLSYPNYSNPNHVAILRSDESVLYKTSGRSPVIIPDEQGAPGADIQWVAYSGHGTVVGDVVYCHYGRNVDFDEIKRAGVDIRGKIALLRYSNGFRGDKVRLAQQHGAMGAILYSDPAEVAKEGAKRVFPLSEWMPSGGVQRGTLKDIPGDPLTPLYPAKKDLYARRSIEEARKERVLPSIPAVPLSYSDAWHILSRMEGKKVPEEWQGGLNISYRMGPGLRNGEKVQIDVKSSLEKRRIKNVIGYIKGTEDVDKYVILGNHFDAWVYGSIDPNSGTAVLTEVARATVQTAQETGWRPKRTIMFCAWDGEEHGLVGSTEFVEEFANVLMDRAVVYLNVDNVHSNQTLYANTVPTMYRIAYEAAKRVRNPMESEIAVGRNSAYDSWIHYIPSTYDFLPAAPEMPPPTGSSDHAAFLNFIGVPVIDFTYRNASWREYPLYHTLYETPFLNEHIFDHNHMSVHRAVGEYWALLAKTFADSQILPLNTTVYAQAIAIVYVPKLLEDLKALVKKFREAQDAVVQANHLVKDATRFLQKSSDFDEAIHSHILFNHRHNLRSSSSVNDRLMAVDRCFINPQGIPGQPQSRHVIYSISEKDTYSASVFAGIYNEIDNMESAESTEDRQQVGRDLAYQISIIQYAVKCAVNTLSEVI